MTRTQETPDITPFWERLPQFFLFPFQGQNLILLPLLSLSSLLAIPFPLPTPVDYLMVEALILLAIVRRGFTVMDAISRGYLTSESQAAMLVDQERVNLPWKLLGVILLWGFVVDLAGNLGAALGWVCWLFTVVTLPAAVMALSVTNSFAAGLNPLLWIGIIRGIGKPYLALLLFLALLSGGTPAAMPLLAPFLKGWLALPLLNFTVLYFTLIMFAMMGYVLYQFHGMLGLPIDRIPDTSANTPPRDAPGDEIAACLASGNIAGALDAAYEQQRLDPENFSVQERYNKLLFMAGKKDRALEHGRKLLALALRKDAADSALELFKQLQTLDPALKPAPAEVLKLADFAHRRRQSELALSVMRAFDRENPGHPDIPYVYFLSAHILSEARKSDESARTILRRLCAKFPDHPVLQEAMPYLRALEAISTATGAGV